MLKRNQSLTGTVAVISLILLLGESAGAGTLEPPANAVDGAGNPAPTMKTLDQIPPSWDQLLSASDGEADGCNSSRYTCVMGNLAVRDNETGLVWERIPNHPASSPVDWVTAVSFCYQRRQGTRSGWRLPTIVELTSVTSGNSRRLPIGHPFDTDCSDDFCVQSALYWSATEFPDGTDRVFRLNPLNGGLQPNVGKNLTGPFWCVRGPGPAQVQP